MRRISLFFMILIIVNIPLLSVEGGKKSATYVNEELGFSFEYPADYKEEPTQTPIEIDRFAKQNDFKLPVFTVSVRDRLDTKLIDLPERIIKSMEETIPNTSNYDINKTKSLKLNDGSDAILFSFSWVWADGEAVMETVMISAYKGDIQITISGTTMKGLDISLKQITKYCMTFKFSR